MTYAESDIAYETAHFWVLRLAKGFEVYEIGATHSVRRASIGYRGAEGLARAIAECDRREALKAAGSSSIRNPR